MSDSAISMAMEVYGTLRRRREERNVSQVVVADLLRCGREHFNKVENGHRTVTADQLFVWAEFLGLKISVQTVTPDHTPERTQ